MLSDEMIPTSVLIALDRMIHKYLNPNDGLSLTPAHRIFVHKYSEAFHRDFNRKSPQFPKSVSQLIVKLKNWKIHFLYQRHKNKYVHLSALSNHLAQFESIDIEIPSGLYNTLGEPQPEQHPILSRFSQSVYLNPSFNSTFASNRRITMLASNGHEYHFYVNSTATHINKSDERMQQLLALLNRSMTKYKETRKRNLQYDIPFVLPITQRIRLIRTYPHQATLDDIWQNYCFHHNQDPDQPLIESRQLFINRADADSHLEYRLSLHNHICSTMIPDYLLIKFIQTRLKRIDEFWVYKNQFAHQAALVGYLTYMLKVADRSPPKLSLTPHATLLNHDFYLTYNESSGLENSEHIPFRLTRNMTSLCGIAALDGIIVACIHVLTSCYSLNQDNIRYFLNLLIRDDLYSWHSQRHPQHTIVTISDLTQQKVDKNLKDKVSANVQSCIKRILMILPSSTSSSSNSSTPLNNQNLNNNISDENTNKQSSIQPCNQKAHHMLKLATSKPKLALMPPTWMAQL